MRAAYVESVLIPALVIYLFLQQAIAVRAASGSNNQLTTQAAGLLNFKNAGIVDEIGVLRSWNSSNLSGVCTGWAGVICEPDAGSVVGLDFTDFYLNGTFTDALCAVPITLTSLHLRDNNFNQSFPYFLLEGDCGANLVHLDLSQNWFYGTLPPNVSVLSNLEYFSLEGNSFTGSIPADYARLSKLQLLRLRGNTLTGTIPPELGNLRSLITLDLAYTSVSGSIPSQFGNLTNLQVLELQGNYLEGSVPSSLSHLSGITMFDLSGNKFSGTFPSSITLNLTSLTQFYLYNNGFTGELPSFTGSHTLVQIIQLDNNSFSGSIPDNYGNLTSLYTLTLIYNDLSGLVPDSLALLKNLSTFDIYGNFLSGSISSEWGLHSDVLYQFDVGYNQLTGTLPLHLCDNSPNLQYISFQSNQFTGSIPSAYANCTSAIRFLLSQNHLTGTVPSGLWTLPNMKYLDLQNNSLSGGMDLPKISNLTTLFIDNNQFEGQIPIAQFRHLDKLTASNNNFSGPIPDDIGLLTKLEILNLTSNSISGQIPNTIANCTILSSLYLSHNQISGPIPSELGTLSVLNYLDLSYNQLNGSIPNAVQKTSYVVFDVAYNDLSGTVSEALVSQYDNTSFFGNPLLCYSDACVTQTNNNNKAKRKSRLIGILAGSLIGVCMVALAVAICTCIQVKKSVIDWKVVSFQRLDFNEEKVFENLEEDNIIGSGGSGKVYKVIFPSGPTVAVKKLQCGQVFRSHMLVSRLDHHNRNSNAFKTEMETLGKIKHKNVIKLLCCCESEETKLLVYEYMPHGSLGDVLHKSFNNLLVNWEVRYNIAFGIAEGLCYLHHDCSTAIIHRDIKSNNILLTSDFQPKVADFGVAKDMKGKFTQMTAVVGSVGYIAPEYAYTLKANEKSDVYSYGVVLLELVTGRSPACREFQEAEGSGINLVKWVNDMMHQNKVNVWKIFDARIDVADIDKESMLIVLRIALHCTSALPQKRPSMREVVELLRRAMPPPYRQGKDQKHVVLSMENPYV